MTILTLSLVGLAAALSLMPAAFDNRLGVNHTGLKDFGGVLGLAPGTALSVSGFSWVFRCLLATAWIGYGLILFAAARDQTRIGTHTLFAIAGLALIVALMFPPSLSSDVYAYAGWGRMSALHGWTPYARTLLELAERGDQAGIVAPVDATATHGPVWIAIVSTTVGLLKGAGLFSQLVALKALAAGAVFIAAVSGRTIARFYDAQKADLACVAVGFNPIFLIEGPGNGHNDVLMVAFLLGGIALSLKERPRLGYSLIGASVGIKFVTIAIVPWLIIRQWSERPRGLRLAPAALAIGLVIGPSLIAYAAFRAEKNPFSGMQRVFEWQTAGGERALPNTTTVHRSASSADAVGTQRASIRFGLLLLVYLGLSAAVWRIPIPSFYLSCWAIFGLALIVLGAPVAFAWYMVWPLATALLVWDRIGVSVNVACAVIGLMLLAKYTVPFVR